MLYWQCISCRRYIVGSCSIHGLLFPTMEARPWYVLNPLFCQSGDCQAEGTGTIFSSVWAPVTVPSSPLSFRLFSPQVPVFLECIHWPVLADYSRGTFQSFYSVYLWVLQDLPGNSGHLVDRFWASFPQSNHCNKLLLPSSHLPVSWAVTWKLSQEGKLIYQIIVLYPINMYKCYVSNEGSSKGSKLGQFRVCFICFPPLKRHCPSLSGVQYTANYFSSNIYLIYLIYFKTINNQKLSSFKQQIYSLTIFLIYFETIVNRFCSFLGCFIRQEGKWSSCYLILIRSRNGPNDFFSYLKIHT